MPSDLFLSKEEKLIINILFDKKILNEKDFVGIDFEKLVIITSGHLMLPTLYFKLKKKSYLNYIPVNLKIYLKKIFNINKERNRILISEIKEISKILNDNYIEHIYLKGASNIISDLYIDIGERMIGDIDILVEKNKLMKTYEIFKTKGYKIKDKNDFFYKGNKHLSRLASKNKIFSIEFHQRLFDSEKIYKLDPSKLFKTKLIMQNTSILDFKNQFLYNIYNYQINDIGSLKLSYSYRTFYDAYLMEKNRNIDFNNFKIDKYLSNYLMIVREMKIPILKKIIFKENKLNQLRFKYKSVNKTFYKIDSFIINFFRRILWIPKQIKQFIISQRYRKHIINKLLWLNR